jgi:hypothetical protein
MSALPPKADIAESSLDVHFVPNYDILRCNIFAVRCKQIS